MYITAGTLEMLAEVRREEAERQETVLRRLAA
jgi:hypothetical protein